MHLSLFSEAISCTTIIYSILVEDASSGPLYPGRSTQGQTGPQPYGYLRRASVRSRQRHAVERFFRAMYLCAIGCCFIIDNTLKQLLVVLALYPHNGVRLNVLIVAVIFYTIFNTLFAGEKLHALRSEPSANSCSGDSTGGEGSDSRRNASLPDWERTGERPRLHGDARKSTRTVETQRGSPYLSFSGQLHVWR